MPDIPLKALGRTKRTREGYTQLDSEEADNNKGRRKRTDNGQEEGDEEVDEDEMTVQAATASAAAATRMYKNKKSSRFTSYGNYKDSPDEEEGLLGGQDTENGYEERGLRSRAGTSSMRSVSWILAICGMRKYLCIASL